MLQCSKISKSFPGVKSLDQVDFSVKAGEIHALLGENGAGKSTLVKIIAGAHKPDEGTIAFEGKQVHWHSPRAAREAGIHVIYQELVLFPELTVGENVFIGEEPAGKLGIISYRKMRDQAAEILDSLGVHLRLNEKVKNLSIADQQMVEIAKSMVSKVKLLILDEPTAVIAGHEVELLFERVEKLQRQGVAVVYISHRLEEIFRLAHRVTMLKDGRLVGTENVRDVDRRTLIRMMVGRDLKDLYPPRPAVAERREAPVLQVNKLSAPPRVKEASLSLYRGEVLGLGGMVGAGRSELALAIFGALPITSGSVSLDGQTHGGASPRRSIQRGLGLLTEDRKSEGLLLQLGVAANITAPKLDDVTRAGFLDMNSERRICQEEIKKFSIAAHRPSAPVVNLSGGNQQKILFSRWTRACHLVLILDEPTRGVDIGAKAEIYRIIRDLANQGLAILMISSELPELIGMCERVVVMRQGQITGELSGSEITEEGIMHLATYET
jgi:ribose transport system ATP-binding protein